MYSTTFLLYCTNEMQKIKKQLYLVDENVIIIVVYDLLKVYKSAYMR